MITKFKIYENLNTRIPKVGEYIVAKNIPVVLHEPENIRILETSAGLVESILLPDSTTPMMYEVVFKYDGGLKGLRTFLYDNNIIGVGSKEEMNMILQANKYNIL